MVAKTVQGIRFLALESCMWKRFIKWLLFTLYKPPYKVPETTVVDLSKVFNPYSHVFKTPTAIPPSVVEYTPEDVFYNGGVPPTQEDLDKLK